MCQDLADRFPTLYEQQDVGHHFAARLLRDKLVPFNHQKGLLNDDTFLAVRNLITIGCQAQDSETREKNLVFMQLAFDTHWLNHFRSFIVGQLDIREQATAAVLRSNLLEWMALMPDQIISKIVTSILMPKLRAAIQSWSPREGIPLERWLTPWCEIVGKKHMSRLFEEMKVQITPVFTDKKMFAKMGLSLFSPWARVLSKQDVVNFTNRYVYPRLISMVKRLEVDPSD